MRRHRIRAFHPDNMHKFWHTYGWVWFATILMSLLCLMLAAGYGEPLLVYGCIPVLFTWFHIVMGMTHEAAKLKPKSAELRLYDLYWSLSDESRAELPELTVPMIRDFTYSQFTQVKSGVDGLAQAERKRAEAEKDMDPTVQQFWKLVRDRTGVVEAEVRIIEKMNRKEDI